MAHRGWVVAAAIAVLSVPWAARVGADELRGSVQIKGSDTMVNLCQAWAEEFMAQHPQVTVAVTGGGSGTGIAALIGGTCDLAASSRRMTDKEKTQATTRSRAAGGPSGAASDSRSRAPQEWRVALDGLAVVVHPSNPIRRLTIQQLADLFTGKIRSWNEIDGPQRAVVLLSREVNSGTHVYFKEHVLGSGQEFAPGALLMPSSQAIADEAATNPDVLGYYGMGYLNPKNAAIAIAKTAQGPYIAPTMDGVRSGTYPIARLLFFYSAGEPQGLVKAFLDFTRSPEGQRIVQQTDFVPVQ